MAAEEAIPAAAEVTLLLDADGDGELERKRLYIDGEGEQARLMLNPEPLAFERFLAQNPHCSTPQVHSAVTKIRTLMKQPISASRGDQIERLLEAVAKILAKDFGMPRPPSVAQRMDTRTIVAMAGGKRIREEVAGHMLVEPLSARQGDGLVGTGVARSATPFMDELHKWSLSYVRGHMLNAKLHGPGQDANLVPISGTCNAHMKNNIEEHLKTEVSSKNGVVSYEIQPLGWGAYKGTDQGSTVEEQLPDKFRIVVQPMTLKAPLIDGTDPDNWQKSGAPNTSYAHPHQLPGVKNFDLRANPRLLSPGSYDTNDVSALYVNPIDPSRWVVQGTLRKMHFSGAAGEDIVLGEPTNVAAADFKGAKLTLTNVNGRLVVTSAPAAAAALDALERSRAGSTKLLGDRMTDTRKLLDVAPVTEHAFARLLDELRDTVKKRLEELGHRGIGAETYAALVDERLPPREASHRARAERIERYETDAAKREQERDALIEETRLFFETQRWLMTNDQGRFWDEQLQREQDVAAMEAKLSELTQPNLQALSELKRIHTAQAHDRFVLQQAAVALQGQFERSVRRSDSAPRRPPSGQKTIQEQTFDPIAVHGDIDIDLDIDLGPEMPRNEPLLFKPPQQQAHGAVDRSQPEKRKRTEEQDTELRPPTDDAKRIKVRPTAREEADKFLQWARKEVATEGARLKSSMRQAWADWEHELLVNLTHTVNDEVTAKTLSSSSLRQHQARLRDAIRAKSEELRRE